MLNVKKHFNAISLPYSPVLFPLHAHIIHSNTGFSFFVNSVLLRWADPGGNDQ